MLKQTQSWSPWHVDNLITFFSILGIQTSGGSDWFILNAKFSMYLTQSNYLLENLKKFFSFSTSSLEVRRKI